LAVLALIWFTPRMQTVSWAISSGLLLGGVTGNLIDRLTKSPGFPNGQVVDFIQIPLNFPIFNVADIFISGMMVWVVIRVFRGEKIGKPISKKPVSS
jgi:signal peptidase II